MVRGWIILLVLVTPLAWADGMRKCSVRDEEDTLSVRYVEADSSEEARQVLQRVLDRRHSEKLAPMKWVEVCKLPNQPFGSSEARRVDRETPR